MEGRESSLNLGGRRSLTAESRRSQPVRRQTATLVRKLEPQAFLVRLGVLISVEVFRLLMSSGGSSRSVG